MRRSNLVLLSMLVAVILFIAAIPVLYRAELAKSRLDANRMNYKWHRYPGVTSVKISNARNITALASDSIGLEYDSAVLRDLIIHQVGDTLTIEGDGRVTLYLPNLPTVVTNSSVLIRGHLRQFDPPSMSFITNNSRIYSLKIASDFRVAQHLQELSIVSDGNSTVDLSGSFSIQKLVLRNLERFSCTNQVGMYETDFLFKQGRDVKTLTCREGINIYNE